MQLRVEKLKRSFEVHRCTKGHNNEMGLLKLGCKFENCISLVQVRAVDNVEIKFVYVPVYLENGLLI
jgi:hypothetical protein